MSTVYFKCPVCRKESTNPTDLAEGYCGNCKDWTGVSLQELPIETPPLLGRVQTGLTVHEGKTWVVLALYDDGDHDVVVQRWRIAPEMAGHLTVNLATATRMAVEDGARG